MSSSSTPTTPSSTTSSFFSPIDQEELTSALKEMVTTDGTNLLDLSQRHMVMISFLKYLGCPLCQHVVFEVGRSMPEFLKLNVIPVIAYQESKQDGEPYFTKSKELNVPIIPRVAHVSPSIHKAFGMKKKGFWDHLNTLPANLKLVFTEHRQIHTPAKSVQNPHVEFGLFLILKGSVLNKFHFKSLCTRPNYAEFLLMIKSENRLSQEMPSIEEYMTELHQMFPTVQAEAKISKSASSSSSSRSSNCHELQQILCEPKSRLLFKVFAMNERSVENVLLYEHVQEFKNIKDELARAKQAEVIYKVFLAPCSKLEVNTCKELVKPVEEAVKAGKVTETLFNDIEMDLILNVMRDTFMRFKQHRSSSTSKK